MKQMNTDKKNPTLTTSVCAHLSLRSSVSILFICGDPAFRILRVLCVSAVNYFAGVLYASTIRRTSAEVLRPSINGAKATLPPYPSTRSHPTTCSFL